MEEGSFNSTEQGRRQEQQSQGRRGRGFAFNSGKEQLDGGDFTCESKEARLNKLDANQLYKGSRGSPIASSQAVFQYILLQVQSDVQSGPLIFTKPFFNHPNHKAVTFPEQHLCAG